MEPGDVLKLRCDAGRRGSVLWYKGDARVQHSTRIHIRAGVMEIIDISFEDSGVYVCVLRGSREMLRNLTITVAGMVDIFLHYTVTHIHKHTHRTLYRTELLHGIWLSICVTHTYPRMLLCWPNTAMF